MGHRYPPAEWFEKAIKLLDAPLGERGADALAPADERAQRVAQRQLEHALRVLRRDEGRGKALLERLVKERPNTDAAEQARAELARLKREEPERE